tara:strand:+ start:4114 stop:4374 length:261 start_codon:yes stop_codon:yes gene_type:complete
VIAFNVNYIALSASDFTNASEVIMRFFQLDFQPILPSWILTMDGQRVQVCNIANKYNFIWLPLFDYCMDFLLRFSAVKWNVYVWYY